MERPKDQKTAGKFAAISALSGSQVMVQLPLKQAIHETKFENVAKPNLERASSFQHNSVLVVTSQSLRGDFAVTSRSHRGHYGRVHAVLRSFGNQALA